MTSTHNTHTPRTLQVLCLVMLSGLLAFSVVALLLGPITKPSATSGPDINQFLLWVLLGMGALQLGIFFGVIGPAMQRQTRASWQTRESDEQGAAALASRFATYTIFATAASESLGIFAAVVLLLTGNKLALAGIAVSVVVLLLNFPTRAKLQQFVSRATGLLPDPQNPSHGLQP